MKFYIVSICQTQSAKTLTYFAHSSLFNLHRFYFCRDIHLANPDKQSSTIDSNFPFITPYLSAEEEKDKVNLVELYYKNFTDLTYGKTELVKEYIELILDIFNIYYDKCQHDVDQKNQLDS